MSYRFENEVYDLTVDEVARVAGRSRRWVYAHGGSRLGGVKRCWDPDSAKATIRFPSHGLTAKLKSMGLTPQG